ncbi:hypothetical protein RAC89_07725 [Paenibacillus sp. GD4]|jgi:hypothetical protein|uniref:hypothetical protein n=1 Tax=Paenibacillus sp. GD4 TaxID=3068890 RepID=UPI00279649FB|nr:hypothetical protein [Paenibacillus sp. GD4]MDQ1910384.1 hypothetical protein [Paenibacillus sp. GD4]
MMEVSKKTIDIRNILTGLNISMEKLLESDVLDQHRIENRMAYSSAELPPPYESETSSAVPS